MRSGPRSRAGGARGRYRFRRILARRYGAVVTVLIAQSLQMVRVEVHLT